MQYKIVKTKNTFLFCSENAEVAKVAIDKFRKTEGDQSAKMFLGITARDPKQTPDEESNPFILSDGTEFDDDDFDSFYKWSDSFPLYIDGSNCAYLGSDSRIYDASCDYDGVALCYVACADSASERSRANLPLFALFVAGSVFKALHVLAGLGF